MTPGGAATLQRRDGTSGRALGAAVAAHAVVLAALIVWPLRSQEPLAKLGGAVAVTLVAELPRGASPAASQQPRDLFSDLQRETPDASVTKAQSQPTSSLDDLLGGQASQTSSRSSPQAEIGDFDPYARAATSFSDNLPADLRKILGRCWRKPAGAKAVRVRFALSQDGGVRDVIILDEEVGATPEVAKIAAERAVRECGPYPAARGAHEYIADLN